MRRCDSLGCGILEAKKKNKPGKLGNTFRKSTQIHEKETKGTHTHVRTHAGRDASLPANIFAFFIVPGVKDKCFFMLLYKVLPNWNPVST